MRVLNIDNKTRKGIIKYAEFLLTIALGAILGYVFVDSVYPAE